MVTAASARRCNHFQGTPHPPEIELETHLQNLLQIHMCTPHQKGPNSRKMKASGYAALRNARVSVQPCTHPRLAAPAMHLYDGDKHVHALEQQALTHIQEHHAGAGTELKQTRQ